MLLAIDLFFCVCVIFHSYLIIVAYLEERLNINTIWTAYIVFVQMKYNSCRK